MRPLSAIGVLLLVLVGGCEPPIDTGDLGADVSAPGGAADDDALAWVNEVPVSDEEVDFFLQHRLNLLPFQADDPALRRRALDSLVAGRAMALLMADELSEEERRELDLEVAFFREELLTKRYLAEYGQPKPVSEAQVVEYYASHADEFGERTVKEIEWLSTPAGLDPDVRESLLPVFQGLDGTADWRGLSLAQNRDAVRVEYRRGVFAPSLLAPRLREVVSATPLNAVSGLHLISGRLHRIRVLEARTEPARPLDEVRSEIRQRLAPVAMRDSVRVATDDVLGRVDVRYEPGDDAVDDDASAEDEQG